MKDIERIEELLSDLRKLTFDKASTRDDIVPIDEDLSKGEFNDLFDIDIFFSRKPGMRRSVQLIKSDNLDKDNIRVSCMTALASLFDTMIRNNLLTREDIMLCVYSWLENNKGGIK